MLRGSIIAATFRGLLPVALALASCASQAHAQAVTRSDYFKSNPPSSSTVRHGTQVTVTVRFLYFDRQQNLWKPLANQVISFEEKYTGFTARNHNYDFNEVGTPRTDASGYAKITRTLRLPREELGSTSSRRGGEFRYRASFPGNNFFQPSASISPNIWIHVKP